MQYLRNLALSSGRCFMLVILSAVACSQSTLLSDKIITLRPGLWVRVPINKSARGNTSQVCMLLPPHYRYGGGKGHGAVVIDAESSRQVEISGNFIYANHPVQPALRSSSNGRYMAPHEEGACLDLPFDARGDLVAIELTSSDTLSVHGFHWDTSTLIGAL